jgi:hypothetical protein
MRADEPMSASEELYRKYNPMQAEEKQMGIDAYDYGKKDGIAEERQRILDWVKENRRAFEFDEGEVLFYRDSFNSEDLIRFIEQKETNEPE